MRSECRKSSALLRTLQLLGREMNNDEKSGLSPLAPFLSLEGSAREGTQLEAVDEMDFSVHFAGLKEHPLKLKVVS